MTMKALLPRASLSPSAPATLLRLAWQSVTPLSRTAFVTQFVKEWVLLREAMAGHCEAIAGHRSDPGRPICLKPALGK